MRLHQQFQYSAPRTTHIQIIHFFSSSNLTQARAVCVCLCVRALNRKTEQACKVAECVALEAALNLTRQCYVQIIFVSYARCFWLAFSIRCRRCRRCCYLSCIWMTQRARKPTTNRIHHRERECPHRESVHIDNLSSQLLCDFRRRVLFSMLV